MYRGPTYVADLLNTIYRPIAYCIRKLYLTKTRLVMWLYVSSSLMLTINVQGRSFLVRKTHTTFLRCIHLANSKTGGHIIAVCEAHYATASYNRVQEGLKFSYAAKITSGLDNGYLDGGKPPNAGETCSWGPKRIQYPRGVRSQLHPPLYHSVHALANS